jgi:hypothetical protein
VSISDLTPLFPQPPIPDLEFRQGKVVAFNLVTGENVIDVGGTHIPNVSLLNITGTLQLAIGDIVGLLRCRTQLFILGRIIVPPI